MMTEQIAPPAHIRQRLLYFQSHEFADLIRAAAADRELASQLFALDRALRQLIARCSDSINVSEAAAVIEEYDRWCELFEELESESFEEEILDAWKALPQ